MVQSDTEWPDWARGVGRRSLVFFSVKRREFRREIGRKTVVTRLFYRAIPCECDGVADL
jgi:hypothetical protein